MSINMKYSIKKKEGNAIAKDDYHIIVILDVLKWKFITLYYNMGLSYHEQDMSEVESDMATYKNLKCNDCDEFNSKSI